MGHTDRPRRRPWTKSLVFTASICLSALRWLLGGGPSFFSDHSFSLSWSCSSRIWRGRRSCISARRPTAPPHQHPRTRDVERVWVPCVTAPWGFEGTQVRQTHRPRPRWSESRCCRRESRPAGRTGRALSRDEIVLLHTVAAHAQPADEPSVLMSGELPGNQVIPFWLAKPARLPPRLDPWPFGARVERVVDKEIEPRPRVGGFSRSIPAETAAARRS